MKKTLKMADKYKNDIIGFICQRRIGGCSFLHLVPGINLESNNDGADQRYTNPSEAMSKGADILIVGRAIINKNDIISECKKYKQIGWDCYQKKNIF